MSVRLFAAIDVPDDHARRLESLMRGVPSARWRPRDMLHLTLRFYGAVPEPEADDIDAGLEALAAGAAPFDLQLAGAGWFGKEEPHALWVGAAPNPALTQLAADVERAARKAGLKPEPRKFAPHVTIASLSGVANDRLIAFVQRHALLQLPPFRVDRISLYSSWLRSNAPSHYRLEAEYPLLG